MKRAAPLGGLRRGIRTGCEKARCDRGMAPDDCEVERGCSAVVPGIDVGALRQEKRYRVASSGCHSTMQRRPTVGATYRKRRPMTVQRFDPIDATKKCSAVKCRLPCVVERVDGASLIREARDRRLGVTHCLDVQSGR